MPAISYTICLGLFCALSLGCQTSPARATDDSISALPKDPQSKNGRQEKPVSVTGTNVLDTPTIQNREIRSAKLPLRNTQLLTVRLDKVGQFDVINLRPSTNREAIIGISRFNYQPERGHSPAFYTSESIDLEKYLSIVEEEVHIGLIPSGEKNPVLFDIAIPQFIPVTLLISGETRFSGKVTQAIAWRGFIKLDGALDSSTAKPGCHSK
jgi:hypothetical protein